MNFDRFGGRTFLLTLGFGIVNSVMRWFDKLDNPTYGLVIGGTVGAYILANAYEGGARTKADAQVAVASADQAKQVGG